MTLLLILTPTRFSDVSHSGVIRVFHELIKRTTIPVIESKQYALSNLRGIINALCALEYNGLNNYHPLSDPIPSRKPSSSIDRIPTYLFPTFLEGASYCWVGIKTIFSTVLATYCLPQFLHLSDHLDFDAPNPGRHHIAYSRHQGGRRPGGLPLPLEGRRLRPQHVGVAEGQQRLSGCLLDVSAAGKAGC